MRKETAYLQYTVDIECPHCEMVFDLVEHNDDDGVISTPIFNNEWDDLKGLEVVCDHCSKEFILEKVEY